VTVIPGVANGLDDLLSTGVPHSNTEAGQKAPRKGNNNFLLGNHLLAPSYSEFGETKTLPGMDRRKTNLKESEPKKKKKKKKEKSVTGFLNLNFQLKRMQFFTLVT
jgi:hypothetical protein